MSTGMKSYNCATHDAEVRRRWNNATANWALPMLTAPGRPNPGSRPIRRRHPPPENQRIDGAIEPATPKHLLTRERRIVVLALLLFVAAVLTISAIGWIWQAERAEKREVALRLLRFALLRDRKPD